MNCLLFSISITAIFFSFNNITAHCPRFSASFLHLSSTVCFVLHSKFRLILLTFHLFCPKISKNKSKRVHSTEKSIKSFYTEIPSPVAIKSFPLKRIIPENWNKIINFPLYTNKLFAWLTSNKWTQRRKTIAVNYFHLLK